MAYNHFDHSKPDGNADGATTINELRINQSALRDAIVAGAIAGWDMTPSGSNASQPDTITYASGVERIRCTLTWNEGAVTVAVWDYSPDSGTNWDNIGTENITYDSDGNVISITWSLP